MVNNSEGNHEKDIDIPEPRIIDAEELSVNRESLEHTEDYLIIQSCKQALEHLPSGSVGIVVGSGSKTAEWKSRGWTTLDIDPSHNPDITADANNLGKVLQESSLDFLVIEGIPMISIRYKEIAGYGYYVDPDIALEQASKLLKIGGSVIIVTSHQEYKETVDASHRIVPDLNTYTNSFKTNGLKCIAEVGPIENSLPEHSTLWSRRVTYYGTKVK